MRGNYRKLARSPASPLTALGVLLSVATVVLFLVDLEARYWDRIATAKKDAQSFAAVLAEHTALTFEDVDHILLEAAVIRRSSLAGKYSDPGAANAALRELQKGSPVLIALGWTDASGQPIAHSYDHAPPRNNISAMSFFTAQRDSSEDRLFIAPPYRSVAGDKWFTAASRRLSNPDGSFAGVVAAPLDQSYFLKLYRSIDLGKGGSITLLHREGRLLARQPEQKDAVGKSFADTPLLTTFLPASETGTFESTSPIDHIARIVGYKAVSGLPMVLIVTYARSDVLAPWYRHLYMFGPLVVAIVSIILFGTFMLVRQTNALASTNARFDAALSNMPDGLSMFDADEKLLISNSRYSEMYELTAEQVKPGTPLGRIVSEYKTEGTGFDPDGFAEGAKARAPHTLTLADGRMILIQRTPMKDGGWVATHSDITEKRQ
jgi:PAS domain-containing protein